jgi:hypothetical protein
MELDGQAATQVPHWMQRSASITPAWSSQNQVLPGGSAIPFISSRMRYAFTATPAGPAAPAGRRPRPGRSAWW